MLEKATQIVSMLMEDQKGPMGNGILVDDLFIRFMRRPRLMTHLKSFEGIVSILRPRVPPNMAPEVPFLYNEDSSRRNSIE